MASLYNLSVKLSAEDAAVFHCLQASALLPSLAQPGQGELVALYKQKQRETQQQLMEPYADILETELLKCLEARKTQIYNKLLASKDASFSVELFKWKTVKYRETLTELKQRESEMTEERLREHHLFIKNRSARLEQMGYESMFSVEKSEYYDGEEETYATLYPVKVDRIFNFTDLALRLSLALGPNFYPYYAWKYMEGESEEGDDGYTVYTKTLCVRYCPYGVSKLMMDKLLACAKKETKRKAEGTKTRLRMSEYGVGHSELNVIEEVDEYADMPPLVPARAAHHCFCGCE